MPVPNQYHTVINWGNPHGEIEREGLRVFNKPEAIRQTIDKLSAFRKMHEAGVRVPDFSDTPPDEPKGIWLARTSLTGSGGRGIVVIRRGDVFPKAPLYTRYIVKDQELRVHVAGENAFFAQAKLRKREANQSADEKLIRNHSNGWIFSPSAAENIEQPVLDLAVSAVKAVGLDFGAVDIVRSKKTGEYYVLEINTAPGLESPTLKDSYKYAIGELLDAG